MNNADQILINRTLVLTLWTALRRDSVSTGKRLLP